MELLILLIKLIIKGLDKAGDGSRQQQQQWTWEQQQAWEQQQREWQARREQWEREQRQLQQEQQRFTQPSPAVPLPGTPRLPAADPGRAGRRRKGQPPAAPPPIPAARRVSDAPPASPAPHDRLAPQPAPRVASADASALARWMRPETLRSEFILTEILKPPLALRPPRE